jgi:carbamoyl-phosphate synthase large subunit
MRSTGEVMGLDEDFGLAFAKSQLAAGQIVPLSGGVVFSVKDADKPQAVSLAQGYQAEGFQIYATSGTADFFRKQGLAVTEVFKVREGRPHIIDRIKSREISLLINTPEGRETTGDSHSIRLVALEHNIPYTTTMAAARATLDSIKAQKRGKLTVKTLQEYHQMIKNPSATRRVTDNESG